ncbi:N/A [soil metagenome]
MQLEARNVGFAYPGGSDVFRDVTFEMRAGEVSAIAGPSGAGKSTLLMCLAGVFECRGQVFYGIEPLPRSRSRRAAARLAHVGFVFQRGELLPDLSVIENVALPLRLQGTEASVAVGKATEWLDRLGLSEVVDSYPGEISGGQAQRASVARALAKEPAIVLADEPTAFLDDESREPVVAALLRAAEGGACVVTASHDQRLRSTAVNVLELFG